MDINYKQDQFELFPGATPGSSGPQPQPRLMFSSLTLSGENIIVLTVIVFLAIIVSFSFGVEKGKHVAMQTGIMTPQKIVQNTPVVSKETLVQSPVTLPKPQTIVQPAPKAPVKQIQTATVTAKANLPVPKAMVPAVQTPANFYTVQVASFKKQEFADQEAQGLKKKGYETFVVAKGQHLILCAGRFSTQDAAKVFSGKLKSKYKDCLVRRM